MNLKLRSKFNHDFTINIYLHFAIKSFIQFQGKKSPRGKI